MSVWNISPADVHVLLGGFYEVVGFADGSFVTITKNQQPFNSSRAMDGEVARVYHSDSRYNLKITVASSSPTNDLFTKLWQLDEATKSVFFPILIKDSLGTSLFFSLEAWICIPPDLSFSNTVETRDWIFECNNGSINLGSNTDNQDILQDVDKLISTAALGQIARFI